MTSPSPASSIHTRRRRTLGLTVLVAMLLLCTAISLSYGARPIPVSTVFDFVTSTLGGARTPGSLTSDERVILELRVPRTALAVEVGAALGIAGALIQGHTRNPLADPGIIGVSAGAALSVMLGFAFFGVSSVIGSSALAFIGAVCATAAVFGLASIGRGTINPLTLVLGGAALSAVLGAITSSLILSNEYNLDRMRFWTVGAVSGRDISVFWLSLPLIALGIVVALATAPTLNILNLGDETATALGINPRKHRIAGMFIISFLAGVATATAGPIGFIGLVVPHIARNLCGADYRWVLPYSALCGATLLLAADILGRFIARPGEIQVGIVLAFVGAPFFIALIYRKKMVAI